MIDKTELPRRLLRYLRHGGPWERESNHTEDSAAPQSFDPEEWMMAVYAALDDALADAGVVADQGGTHPPQRPDRISTCSNRTDSVQFGHRHTSPASMAVPHLPSDCPREYRGIVPAAEEASRPTVESNDQDEAQ